MPVVPSISKMFVSTYLFPFILPVTPFVILYHAPTKIGPLTALFIHYVSIKVVTVCFPAIICVCTSTLPFYSPPLPYHLLCSIPFVATYLLVPST
jgi:hypothetical protein